MANILLKHFGSKILTIDKSKKAYHKLKNLMNKIILKGHLSLDEMILMPKEVAQVELLRTLTGIYKMSSK